MPRSVLVRVVFGVLVLATFAAFLVAQRLKRSTPIVERVYYKHYIAPTCHCRNATARFFFQLRQAGRVTVTVVNDTGDEVRTLVHNRRLSTHRHNYVWDGRTDAGATAPDGVYHLRVTLFDEGRSVTLGRALILDTRPPQPRVTGVTPPVIVPGARGAAGRAAIRFSGRSSAPPLVRLYRTDLPRPRLVAAFQAQGGGQSATWDGLVGGRPAPDGVYEVSVTTYDPAGNAGSFPRRLPPTRREATPGSGVSVRYLTLGGPLAPVAAGSVARFQVGPLPQRLRWRLAPPGVGAPLARGKARAGTLALRVTPRATTGLYLLTVQAGRHRAAQPVAVQGRRRARVLVVLPAIAWQGDNQVDDDGDGFPNTLGSGDSVRLVRPFAHGRPPAGLVGAVAPLLRFLSGERVAYEITTDLALAQGGGSALAGHSGVLFVGDETWLTNRLDLALRRYVESGGRLASFGTDSFRRRVSLGPNTLADPTSAERFDAFGEQVAELRIEDAPLVVNQPDALGLFSGTDGFLGLFSSFEQSQRLEAGAQVLSSAGREPGHPAFVAYRLGRGIVVRAGVQGWSSELATDAELGSVTRRIWSLLSR